MILVAVKTWNYNSDDINLARTQESIVDELKIMVRVEEKRQLSYDKTFSQFVIQLIGCGLTPTVVDQHPNGYTTHTEGCPFLVLEYAEVQFLSAFQGLKHIFRMETYSNFFESINNEAEKNRHKIQE